MKNKPYISLRWRFLGTAILCLFIAGLFMLMVNSFLRQQRSDFTREFESAEKRAVKITSCYKQNQLDDAEKMLIDGEAIFRLNQKGEVLDAAKGRYEKVFDLEGIKTQKKPESINDFPYTYYYLMPFEEGYILYSSQIECMDVSWLGGGVLVVWLILFLGITSKKINYIHYINQKLEEVAKGQLDVEIRLAGNDEIMSIAKHIQTMLKSLKRIKEKEEELQTSKDNFLLNISHDLRTPLTSVIGYLSLLETDYISEEEKAAYLKIVKEKSLRLDHLINEFFEFSTLTFGEIKLNKENICLSEFLCQIGISYLPDCQSKNLNILMDIEEDDVYINLDPQKMIRVFDNLIINAIRHSKEGSNIIIGLKAKEEVIIKVENEGELLSEDALINVFERFYRKDQARSTKAGGAGLGLAISKSIIEAHEGKIWAENTQTGVRFNIVLMKASFDNIISIG